MGMIDLNDKEMLFHYVKEQYHDEFAKKVFTAIDTDAETYYESRDCSQMLLSEYGFRNIVELEEQLKKMWPDKPDNRLAKICAVAAFKLHQAQGFSEDNQKTGEEAQIPDFIYNF